MYGESRLKRALNLTVAAFMVLWFFFCFLLFIHFFGYFQVILDNRDQVLNWLRSPLFNFHGHVYLNWFIVAIIIYTLVFLVISWRFWSWLIFTVDRYRKKPANPVIAITATTPPPTPVKYRVETAHNTAVNPLQAPRHLSTPPEKPAIRSRGKAAPTTHQDEFYWDWEESKKTKKEDDPDEVFFSPS